MEDWRMGTKRVVLLSALIAVIVVCAVIAFLEMRKSPPPPGSKLREKTKIVLTVAPYTVREITIGEKLELPHDSATGRMKLDKQLWGEPHPCASCGELIPEIVIKPGTPRPGRVQSEAVCPRCGKPAYAAP